MARPFVVSMFAVLALVGCARVMFTRPDTTQAQFDADMARCQYEAVAATATYNSSAPVPYSTGAEIGQGIGLGIGAAMKQNQLITLHASQGLYDDADGECGCDADGRGFRAGKRPPSKRPAGARHTRIRPCGGCASSRGTRCGVKVPNAS